MTIQMVEVERKELGDARCLVLTHTVCASELLKLLHSCFHRQQCHFPAVCPSVLESLGLVSHGTVGCSAHGRSNAHVGKNEDCCALAIINTQRKETSHRKMGFVLVHTQIF